MKKLLLLLLVLTLSLLCLASCGGEPTPEPEPENPPADGEQVEIPFVDLGGITLPSRGFIYNGEAHSIAIRGTLPEDVTVEYENNAQVNAGKYTVVAKFYWKGHYLEGRDKSSTLTVNKASYNVSSVYFPSVAYGYDGNAHTLAIVGELPEGLTVSYSGGNASAVGEYTVTASFSGDFANYSAVESKTATLTITEAIPAGVSFRETFVDFDGAEKSILAEGTLPAGVTVTYAGNGARESGDYEVTADFGQGYGRITQLLHISAHRGLALNDSDRRGLIFAPYSLGGCAVVGYEGSLDYVVIPDTYNGEIVKSIDPEAFKGNTAIKYVYLGKNVENVATSAFLDCTSLELVTMSDKLRSVGQRAFENTALRRATFGTELTAIGFAAFRGTPVESLTLPFIGGSATSSNKFIGFIFGASGYAANRDFVPETLKTLVLNDACTELPAYSLYGCESIECIVIGKGVKTIGISSMAGCTSLKSIYIPTTVTRVYGDGFYYNGIFFGCDSELKIYMGATFLPSGYGQYWLCRTESEKYTATFGVTYDEYLALAADGEAA